MRSDYPIWIADSIAAALRSAGWLAAPVPEPEPPRIGDRVLDAIRERPGITTHELAECLDESPKTMGMRLSRLWRRGAIEKRLSGGRWRAPSWWPR